MRRFIILATLFVAFAATATEGANVTEILDSVDLTPLDDLLPKDINLTALALAIDADHPHINLNVMEVIKLYEYPVEIHSVETSDGYILEMHRIPGNVKNRTPEGKRVVFLQHGLLCSSMDWVLAGPERGLAFILADAGYDVWMGNARGNRYSRKHKQYSVVNPKFWNFDWHEIGTRDLPTMIDHVLKVTGRQKLYYIGHSQGSTAFFVMTSELPQYNNKINAMFSLAPVAYCKKMFSPIFQVMARLVKPLNLLTNLIGMYEFKPTDTFFKRFTSVLCSDSSVLQPFCTNVLFLISGFNWEQMDTALLPAILAHVPAGAAVNQFVHYAQIIKSGHFRQFDHGFLGNLGKYGKITPPTYNLKNVKAPVSLHYSVNDWLSDTNDVQTLYANLQKPVGKFRVPDDKFNHLDYLWAKDVKTLLYNKILTLMKRYKD